MVDALISDQVFLHLRISPSKGFDLLKEDFDYYIISLVLAALVFVSYLTRKLSQRKSLKQAWR